MNRWVARRLRTDTWSPSDYFELTEDIRLGPWRGEWEYVPLLTAAERVAPSSEEPREDASRSGVRDFRGLTAFVQKPIGGPRDSLRLGDDLREGDVLVPPVAEDPCVLVTRKHEGHSFVRSFAILRAHRFDATALWGLLTSRQGTSFRRSTMRASSPSTRFGDAFWKALLPVLPESVIAHVRRLVPDAPLARKAPSHRSETRWYTADLRSTRLWSPSRSVIDVASVQDAVELQDLGRVFVGRSDPRTAVAAPGPNRAPLITSSWLRGKAGTPTWIENAQERRTEPGTIALLTLPPFSARVVPEGAVLQRGLIAVECHHYRGAQPESVASWLVAYLTSDVGFERLSSFATSTTIPRLTAMALRALRLPVPAHLSDATPKAASVLDASEKVNLADQLDEAIWGGGGTRFDPSPFTGEGAPVRVRVR
jgi:hypothetical protein